MQFECLPLRGAAAVVILAACGGAPAVNGPAAAATQPLMWQQIARARVLCLVSSEVPADNRALQDALCARVREMAAEGAPIPVDPVGFGDPAVLEPDTVTLLVHASVQADGDGRLLIFSIRPFRPARPDSAELFGAAPRAVRLSGSALPGPELDSALAAALAQTLPWKQGA
ncbi:MAG TPA: hypothetical protein VK472_06520 [Allosphingosinicella sp.]|nr:hypothetical protein [Allosphingosinicella sp.]